MIILGNTYFWKFLKSCDPVTLEEHGARFCTTLSRVMGYEFKEATPDIDQLARMKRWSEGAFNELGERKLQFPRISWGYKPASGDNNERWISDAFCTRIPHVRGIYSNRDRRHNLSLALQRSLSAQLLKSFLADVFILGNGNNTVIGRPESVYLYFKIQNIPSLKKLAEQSKYIPPQSDLGDLLKSLAAVLAAEQKGTLNVEIQNERSNIKSFLESCDRRVSTSLSLETLHSLLQPTSISAKEWMNAGRLGFIGRLMSAKK